MGDLLEPIPVNAVHLCVDMQRIFSSEGVWPTPWMERVLPTVTRIAERFPERTVFTRFITPETPEAAIGRWRAYYEKWRETTRDRLDPHLLELMPRLAALVPPGAGLRQTCLLRFCRIQTARAPPGTRRRHADCDRLGDRRVRARNRDRGG